MSTAFGRWRWLCWCVCELVLAVCVCVVCTKSTVHSLPSGNWGSRGRWGAGVGVPFPFPTHLAPDPLPRTAAAGVGVGRQVQWCMRIYHGDIHHSDSAVLIIVRLHIPVAQSPMLLCSCKPPELWCPPAQAPKVLPPR